MIEQTFFELIQVAIGTRICLSHTPTADEWSELYAMAKKQSLVGVCFAAVQKLNSSNSSNTSNLSELQYLTWMGMAAKIQQKNEVFRKKGEELIDKLHAGCMDACILKGQSLAPYYGDLAALRQSGDIDVWVKNKSVMELDAYVEGLGLKPHTTAAHVSYEDKDGVEVELHPSPSFLRCFWNDRKLQQWFRNVDPSSSEFNLVYMMVHMYHHVLFEGLGLRQLMDYYFVLCTSYDDDTFHYDNDNLISTIELLGMLKFATGIMWIMKEVFALENRYLICEANEKFGRLILGDVLQGGNFGHYDERDKNIHHGNALVRTFGYMKRNLKFFSLGPAEVLSSPLWSLWHWRWRKKHGLI